MKQIRDEAAIRNNYEENCILAVGKMPETEFFPLVADNELEFFQKWVGGYIECVTLGDIVVICNEEGRLLNLPYNCTINGIEFYGDILLVGQNGCEFADYPKGHGVWSSLSKVF